MNNWPNFGHNGNPPEDENPPIEPVSSGDSNINRASSSNFDNVSTSNAQASNLAFDPVSSTSTNTGADSLRIQGNYGYAEASLDFSLNPDVDISDPFLVENQRPRPQTTSTTRDFPVPDRGIYPEYNNDIPLEPSQTDEMVSSTSMTCSSQRPVHIDDAFSSFEHGDISQTVAGVDSSSMQQGNSRFVIPNEVNSTTTSSPKNTSTSLLSSTLQISNTPIIASTSASSHPSDPTKFHLDQQLLDQVLEFGFEEYIATLAIERTNGVGIEEAVNWIIDHSNQSDLEEEGDDNIQGNEETMGATTSNFSAMIKSVQPRRTHKMVLVANMGLKMGVGKLAAQVGHATLGVYRIAQKTQAGQDALNAWRNYGEVKIVVKGQSTEQLLDLFKQAKDAVNNMFF